ncbi:MAG: SRPBCC family protein [Bacteroidota bacterium]
MSLHILTTKQILPCTLEEAWEFLSRPDNLKKITPEYMGFDITSGYQAGDPMYAGMIITYKVKPVPFITTSWVTEISHVNAPYYFVDEQRFGPYTLWHHKHLLKVVENGIEMTDIIHYKIPMGFIGNMLNSIFIKRQLSKIFSYRYQKLCKLIGEIPNQKPIMEFKKV